MKKLCYWNYYFLNLCITLLKGRHFDRNCKVNNMNINTHYWLYTRDIFYVVFRLECKNIPKTYYISIQSVHIRYLYYYFFDAESKFYLSHTFVIHNISPEIRSSVLSVQNIVVKSFENSFSNFVKSRTKK